MGFAQKLFLPSTAGVGLVCQSDANGTPPFHGAMAFLAEIAGNLQFDNTPLLGSYIHCGWLGKL
jgi:hypothetical protein